MGLTGWIFVTVLVLMPLALLIYSAVATGIEVGRTGRPFLESFLDLIALISGYARPGSSRIEKHSISPQPHPLMKGHWLIVAVPCLALIGAGIVVHNVRNERQLAKRAGVYRVRAEQGDAKSQWALGAMYYYGKGVPKDYVEAMRWYRKSAEQGDPNGEYSLAHMYHDGKGVPQDDSEAARWCRKSADQGYPQAQYDLGWMYYYGHGVPQDRVQANDLFQQAAAHGNEDAKRALECDRKGISIDPGAGLRGLQ